jgi:hypothetical protein
VVSLTSDNTLMDKLSLPHMNIVLNAFQQNPTVVNLMAKNLAMSTAMIIYHGKNEDDIEKSGSQRVQNRSRDMLRLLNPSSMVQQELNSLRSDEEFFRRNAYNSEQRGEIEKVFNDMII